MNFDGYLNLAAAIVNAARDDYLEAREMLDKEEILFDPPPRTGTRITEATKAIVTAIAATEAGPEARRVDMREAMDVKRWRDLKESQGVWFCDKNNRAEVIKKAQDIRRRKKAKRTIEEIKEFLCSEYFDNITLSVVDPVVLWNDWKRIYSERNGFT